MSSAGTVCSWYLPLRYVELSFSVARSRHKMGRRFLIRGVGAGPILDTFAIGPKALARLPLNIRCEADLVERLRNAVWHLGRGLTVTSMIEDAMLKAVQQLEQQHNGGKPFPPRGTRVAKSPPRRG
jgi:hypothetical protein